MVESLFAEFYLELSINDLIQDLFNSFEVIFNYFQRFCIQNECMHQLFSFQLKVSYRGSSRNFYLVKIWHPLFTHRIVERVNSRWARGWAKKISVQWGPGPSRISLIIHVYLITVVSISLFCCICDQKTIGQPGIQTRNLKLTGKRSTKWTAGLKIIFSVAVYLD